MNRMWSFSRESKLKYEVLKIVYCKPGTRELNFLFINEKKKIMFTERNKKTNSKGTVKHFFLASTFR